MEDWRNSPWLAMWHMTNDWDRIPEDDFTLTRDQIVELMAFVIGIVTLPDETVLPAGDILGAMEHGVVEIIGVA